MLLCWNYESSPADDVILQSKQTFTSTPLGLEELKLILYGDETSILKSRDVGTSIEQVATSVKMHSVIGQSWMKFWFV